MQVRSAGEHSQHHGPQQHTLCVDNAVCISTTCVDQVCLHVEHVVTTCVLRIARPLSIDHTFGHMHAGDVVKSGGALYVF